MLNIRPSVILAAPPAGLIVAALAWMAFSGERAVVDPVQAVETAFTALDLRPRTSTPGPDPAAQLLAAPVFASISANGGAADVAVRLEGLESTPTHRAALLSINNGAAAWIEVGASKAGVTLRQVDAAKVVIETPSGLRELLLGETSTPSTQGAAPGGAPAPSGSFRMPPPPASAPAARQ